MTRSRRWIAVVVVALLATGLGFGAGLLARHQVSRYPEISVYSQGHAARVGPYLFCNVLDLNNCHFPQTQVELPVSERGPVQLSVPMAIGRAPWRLLKLYRDDRDATETVFRPDARLAVTIPTVDPHRGDLLGIVVQLLTLAYDSAGELRDIPHAEWSVRLIWP